VACLALISRRVGTDRPDRVERFVETREPYVLWSFAWRAAAKMRLTFSSEKNTAGDVTPALTRANSFIASGLPWTAASSCWSSVGGGWSVASWVVNSYMGKTCSSRRDWYSPIATSKERAPENDSSSAVVHSSASRKAWDPLSGDEVFVVAGVTHERPARAERLAEEVRDARSDVTRFALRGAKTIGKGRDQLDHFEVMALDVLLVLGELGERPAADDECHAVVGRPRRERAVRSDVGLETAVHRQAPCSLEAESMRAQGSRQRTAKRSLPVGQGAFVRVTIRGRSSVTRSMARTAPCWRRRTASSFLRRSGVR
jgi:hypothetical protein